jgi:predicted acylesterase/phospholipase RssA
MKYMIVGPGSMAIYTMIGNIVRLEEDGHLKDLREISGSSAGSLCAFSFLLGRKQLTKLVDVSLSIPVDKIFKYNITNIIKTYGCINMKKVRSSLSDFCHTMVGLSDITFEELYKRTEVKLHIPAYSLSRATNVYFSVDSSPSMSVIDAVCASMSIPILMPPFEGEYLDGSITEEIPYMPFLQRLPEDVHVLRVESGVTRESKNFIGYIVKLVNILHSSLRHKTEIYQIKPILIDIDVYKFNITHETKLKLYIKGYTTTL